MTQKRYHSTLQTDSTRLRCPVCHEAVYSRAGIHPQCAVRQSDPPKPRNPPTGAHAVVKAVVDPPGGPVAAHPDPRAAPTAALPGGPPSPTSSRPSSAGGRG